MTRTAAFYTDAALDALNAGFTSKAGQKRANEDLARAYYLHKVVIQNALLADRSIADWDSLYYGVPDLHNWKARHSAAYAAWPHQVAEIEKLVELRAAVKAAPVNAPERSAPHPLEVKVREALADLLARRKAQFLHAVDLCTVFGDGVRIKGLTASTHWVTNEHGTTFLRTFYYLFGRLTPLNTIIAAAEEQMRRAEAA